MDEAAARKPDTCVKRVEKGSADNSPLSESSYRNSPTRSIPVTVCGQLASGSFTEETKTQVITPKGALLTLVARVPPGQVMQLKNRLTRMEQDCRVLCADQTPTDKPKLLTVEFLDSEQNFWSAQSHFT
jgi:hypothetical protein